MNKLLSAVSIACVALSSVCAQPVRASDWSNAVDVCQGSLPSFEGSLRKRPLGINNEGATTSFVSCSLRAPLGEIDVEAITALFTNRADRAVDVSCTLVDGIASPGGAARYQTKTFAIGTGSFALIGWERGSDNGGTSYSIPNLNCALMPGVEINVLQLNTRPRT